MSTLELVIGPMFSQKCLNPDFCVLTNNGIVKKIEDLTLDDKLISPEGKDVNILSLVKGTARMYDVKINDFVFKATDNHILVFKNKYYFSLSIGKLRSIVYYLDENKKISSFPCLKKYIGREINKLDTNKKITPGDSIIEMTVKEYDRNKYHMLILNPLISNFSFDISKEDMPEEINTSYYTVVNSYLKTLLNDEESSYVGFELEGNGLFLSHNNYIFHNSTYLKTIYNKYKYTDKKISIYSHILDKERYSTSFLTTHNDRNGKDGLISMTFLPDIKSILNTSEYKESDMIIIEEAQFFEDLHLISGELDKTNKNFIICGLSSDYKREPFGGILNLIPHADKLTKLSSFCSLCKDNTEAIYTKKINKDDHRKIGSEEIYTPVCRFHYLS